MTAQTLQNDIVTLPEAPAIPGLIFRHFHGDADFPAMAQALMASEAADGAERVITLEEITNTYRHLPNCDLAQDVLLAEMDGDVIGYCRVEPLRSADAERLYFHLAFLRPEWRRKGIGSAMLRWAQGRLRHIAASQPQDGPRFFQAFVSDTAAGAEALLQGDGYCAVRHGFEMVRPDLEDIPDFLLPDGIEVRAVTPDHYRLIWEADVEAFRDHWGFIPPSEADYDAWLHDPTVFQPHLWQIAWDAATNQIAGQVRGFINAHENAQFNRRRGWCEFISVRRPWRKRGLARALIVRTLRLFREQRMTESALGVDTQNLTGALRVYEACGFRPVRRSTTYRKSLD